MFSCEYEAPKSSNYVNLQMNRTNKPSTDINLTESEIGSYAVSTFGHLDKIAKIKEPMYRGKKTLLYDGKA